MLAPYVRKFIRASLVWFAIGIVIGLSMAFWPADHIVYRPAHAHANLLGFVSMFIFGVAYHVIPRFVGRPLWGERYALWHVWIQNVGLALLTVGWMVQPSWWRIGRPFVWAGAILSAAGVAIFIAIVWKSVAPRPDVEFEPPGS